MSTRKIYWLVFVGILLFGLSPVQANASTWGPDILIWGGDISCFDVDYTMDGTMYLAFQEDAGPNYWIHFFISTDHGYTWEHKMEYPMPGRINKIKLIAGEPVHNFLYFFFVNPPDKYLLSVKLNRHDFSIVAEVPVDTLPVIDEGFDVTRTLEDNYALWAACWYADTGLSVQRSLDFGETWEPRGGVWPFYGFDKYLSIAYGPPSYIYVAYSVCHWASSPESLEVEIYFTPDAHSLGGIGWGDATVTDNASADYDPHIAASNDPAYPAIWIVYTHDWLGTGDLDLRAASVPTPDSIGGTWDIIDVSSSSGADEYWGDIEFYKGFPNRWVNMVYIADVVGVYRYAIRTWSSGGNPASWTSHDTLNDHDAHHWPYGPAPRIVYSPGAPATGGGVVYAGVGGHDLYFDAPWVTTGIEESAPPDFSYFKIYPNPLTENSPLELSISEKGFVEVSVYDLSGRLAYRMGPVLWRQGSHSLVLDRLHNGVYFLELKLNGRLSRKTKLIILR